jgi:hypothetical protein
MKTARRKNSTPQTSNRRSKSIAQRYEELLRLRELVQKVEKKAASARR